MEDNEDAATNFSIKDTMNDAKGNNERNQKGAYTYRQMSLTTVDDCELFETPPTTEIRIDVSSDLVIVRSLLQETVELYQIELI